MKLKDKFHACLTVRRERIDAWQKEGGGYPTPDIFDEKRAEIHADTYEPGEPPEWAIIEAEENRQFAEGKGPAWDEYQRWLKERSKESPVSRMLKLQAKRIREAEEGIEDE
jgi:hypothetical protein